jgi:hypothetical protein
MSECWDEGTLRAYLDREMAPEEMTRIAAHLGGCAECHARYNEVAARAARVSSMMSGLEPVTVVPAARHVWLRPAAAVLALAAAAALMFILTPKRVKTPRPVATPRIEHVRRPIQAEAPAETPATEVRALPVAHARISRAKVAQHVKFADTDYFLALDDDPIELGVVVRVALDGAAAVQADVVFDADGRPRAIRPVQLAQK